MSGRSVSIKIRPETKISCGFFLSLYSLRQWLYHSNSLFSKKFLWNKLCLILKDIKFSDTDKINGTTLHSGFCIKMFLEAIPTRLQSFFQRKEKREIAGTRRKIKKKSPIYFELVATMATIFRR